MPPGAASQAEPRQRAPRLDKPSFPPDQDFHFAVCNLKYYHA
jgi:hypothetical protein